VTAAVPISLHVNGERVALQRTGARFTGRAIVPASVHQGVHSVWRGAYGSIVTAIVRLPDGRAAGAYKIIGGIG